MLCELNTRIMYLSGIMYLDTNLRAVRQFHKVTMNAHCHESVLVLEMSRC